MRTLIGQAWATAKAHFAASVVFFTTVGALFGTYATPFVTDYFQHKSTMRTIVQGDVDQLKSSDTKLFTALQKFADKANGKGSTTNDDLNSLREATKTAYMNAAQLKDRLPELTQEFKNYAAALIELQNAAEELTGPLDASRFVEAVSKYVVAQRDMNQKAVELQRRWLAWN